MRCSPARSEPARTGPGSSAGSQRDAADPRIDLDATWQIDVAFPGRLDRVERCVGGMVQIGVDEQAARPSRPGRDDAPPAGQRRELRDRQLRTWPVDGPAPLRQRLSRRAGAPQLLAGLAAGPVARRDGHGMMDTETGTGQNGERERRVRLDRRALLAAGAVTMIAVG